MRTFCALAVAMVAMGVAEAQTTVYERGAGTDWSASDVSQWPVSISATTSVSLENGIIAREGGNTSYALTHAVGTQANSKVTYTAKWYAGHSTGNAGNFNYLRMGGVEFRSWGQSMFGSVIIGASETTVFDKNKELTRGGSWDITLTVDKANGTAEYSARAYAESGYEFTFSGSGHVAQMSDDIVFGFNKGGRTTYTVESALVSIIVAEEVQDIKTADYTIRYVDADGNEIREASVRQNPVGNEIVITQADQDKFTAEDQLYIFESSDVEGKKVLEDGSAVVNVKFRKANKFAYTLRSSKGNDVFTSDVWEGDRVFTNYPRFFFTDNGGVVEAVQQNASAYYVADFVVDQPNYVFRLPYMSKPSYGAMVFFAEADTLEGFIPSGNGAVPNRASNGNIGYVKEPTTLPICTLPAGSYVLRTSLANMNQSDFIVRVLIGEDEIGRFSGGVNGDSRQVYSDFATEVFTAQDSITITFDLSGGGSTQGVDYVLITTAEPLEGVDQTPDDARNEMNNESGLHRKKVNKVVDNNFYTIGGVKVSGAGHGVFIHKGKLIIK